MDATNSEKLETYKKQAFQEFADAHSLLRDKTAQANEQYVSPAIGFVSDNARNKPLHTALVAAFVALSFVPVLVFAFFAIGTVLVVGGGSLIFALFWIFILVGGAGLLLAGTIVLAALGAVGLVAWLGSMYATYRLVSNMTRSSTFGTGLQEFKQEMNDIVFGRSSSSGHIKNGGRTRQWSQDDNDLPSKAASTIHAL